MQTVLDFEQSRTLFSLRRFIGIVNAYRHCIRDASSILVLQGAKKKDIRPVFWDDTSLAAFHRCRRAPASAVLLAHPRSNAQLRITSDASNIKAGAVLEQFDNNQWRPLAFFSKSFSQTEQRYSVYDREFTALFLAIKHFRGTIEDYSLELRMDQKPLFHAFKQKSDNASPRQLRQLNFIAQFSTDVEHISGTSNVVADALSSIDETSYQTSSSSIPDRLLYFLNK